MKLFGVINASPDSLHEESIVRSPADAARRAEWLLSTGVWGFDLGGQGSTFAAGETRVEEEWSRLEPIIPVLLSFDVPVSVDTWRPETARRALDAGVGWLNAADGLQNDAMMTLAAEYQCPVVLPFLSGPDPLRMEQVTDHDPVAILLGFFDAMVSKAEALGIRQNLVIDPGTGFAPHDWPWEERYVYQKQVYSQLDRLRIYDLPLYIALPWKDTVQHNELLGIVIDGQPEYGRCHYPDRITAAIESAAIDSAAINSAAVRARGHQPE